MSKEFKEVDLIPKESLVRFLAEMSKWGSINSKFYESRRRLKSVNLNDEFRKERLFDFIRDYGGIKDNQDMRLLDYQVLNRFEFQGSLALKFYDGGVYGRATQCPNEARALAIQLVDDVFPLQDPPMREMHEDFRAYKISTEGWSNLLDGHISWGYIAHEPYMDRWWFLYYNSSS